MIISDFVLVLSCYALPFPLLYISRRCSQTMSSKCRAVVSLFVLFIVLCGSTHAAHVLMAAKLLTSPTLSETLTLVTAFISVLIVIALVLVVPDAVSLCESTVALTLSLQRTAKQLEEANHNAQVANDNKTEFMAFLCHELRNPLHVINANADFLGETRLSIEQEDYVRSIHDNGKLMAHIVNDVLDISRMTSGHMTLEAIPVNLHDLTSSLVRNTRHQAAVKQIDLKLEYAAGAPNLVLTDPTRVHQLLLNLLSNAIKFTNRQGRITLRVRAFQHNPLVDTHLPKGARKLICGKSDDESDFVINESTPPQPNAAVSLSNNNKDNMHTATTPTRSSASSSPSRHTAEFTDGFLDDEQTLLPHDSSPLFSSLSDQDDDDDDDNGEHVKNFVYIQLEVSDTGVGISSSLMPQLFNPYTQAKLSTVREHGGTGLGLSIVHQIIKSMRGNIHVHSRIGHGSTFTITLKVETVREQDLHIESTANSLNDNNTPTEQVTPISSPHITIMPSSSPRVTSETPIPLTATSQAVLVVDDNDINRKILGRILSSLGYRVVTCCDGLEAVAAVQSCPASDPFLCVFMDISMPNMDGYEATRHIRAGFGASAGADAGAGAGAAGALSDSKNGSGSSSSSVYNHADVYIIALTANALADERLKAKEAGMNDFATKPIRKNEIARILLKLSNKRILLNPPPNIATLSRATSSLPIPPHLSLTASPLNNPRSSSDPSAAAAPIQIAEEEFAPTSSPDKRHDGIRKSLMQQSFAVNKNHENNHHQHKNIQLPTPTPYYTTPLMSTVRLPLKQFPQQQQQQKMKIENE